LPAGTLLESLKNRYLITGKEFFDYGASELLVQLVSFAAIDEINLLSKPVILRAREERSLLAVSLILAFALIMYWITLRLQKMTRNITDVSQNMLGTKPKGIQKGDQLQILEERFKTFLLQDIVDMKTHRDALEHRAMHDFLTGLPNRALLQDRLQQAVLTGQREGKPLAFLMMDLDRFKKINDSFGHQIGDLLLKKVGKRMSGVLRKTDTLARLGGDEFALVLPAADAEQAKRTAHKLLKSLKDPFIVDNHTLQIGTSIGVAMFPEHGEDIGRLLHRADVAMYVAKKTGTGLSLFQPEYDQYHSEYYVLSRDLKNALDGEELFVYFQPKVDMKTGGVSGVEGLLRWHHPKYGFIPPDKIIPLAETLGLIKPLTLLVLKSVFHHYGEWHRDGIDSEMCISVNLSRHNLQDLDFPGEVDDLLKTLDVEPSRIVFEITEGAVMADPEHVLPTLQQLTSMGIRISVDDFGTGFSSLAYLNKMPLYEIKIDKSFVMNMETNANDSSIVRSSIQLAHNFGLSVVAEGVECQNTWALLEGFGCDSVQGYHLCRPLPAQEFKDWLNERHSRLAEKDLNMR
jgi:diguanylate cyclase (GGDEF)-like protein